MIEILTDNHFDRLMDTFDSVNRETKIISPFLTISMAEKLCEIANGRNIPCTFITRFYLEDIISKANSIDALELLIKNGITVFAVKRLHTKLYLFDDDSAILGSANFTNGGFKSNIELSLLLSEEHQVLGELHAYFDDMVAKIKNARNGLITPDIIAEARKAYISLLNDKKRPMKTISTQMYGATLSKWDELTKTGDILEELEKCRGETDLVCTLFKSTELTAQIKYPYNIWLKFSGQSDDRFDADTIFSVVAVQEQGRIRYLANYPFMVRSIKEDDEIYFAALSTDKRGKNQPVIVGRGHLARFSDSNRAADSMIQQYPWMGRYPYYCIIKDCEIIKAPIKECIALNTVLDALGSNTYMSSFGREEGYKAVSIKHHQKAHIRLSGNAKQYIDTLLNALKAKYGVDRYQSDIEYLGDEESGASSSCRSDLNQLVAQGHITSKSTAG